MKNFPNSKWEKKLLSQHGNILDSVIKRIKKEGPLKSSDFKHKKKTGTWWDWKPTKRALEILFWRGDLMISGRDKFQKLYDLTERVLPAWVDTTQVSQEERADYLIKKALDNLGIASFGDIYNYMWDHDKHIVRNRLDLAIKDKEVTKICIPEIPNETFYANRTLLEDKLDNKNNTNANEENVTILSPFDNFTINRERMRVLFDFNYAIECYTPKNKRKYGYFCHPILWNNQLVGRVDLKADRKSKTLLSRGIFLEKNFKANMKFEKAFAESLEKFAKFNNCSKVSHSKTQKSSRYLLEYLSV
jgi:uncharacterized protein YcaQ